MVPTTNYFIFCKRTTRAQSKMTGACAAYSSVDEWREISINWNNFHTFSGQSRL